MSFVVSVNVFTKFMEIKMKESVRSSKSVKVKDKGDQMGVKKGTSKEKMSSTKTMKQKSSCMCGR